jgi:hypothetical protein
LTTSQLKAALLTDADVPDTTINPQEETADIPSAQEQDTIASGVPGCQKLLDADNLNPLVYGTTAQVGRDLLGGPTRYDLALAAMPGTNARQAVAGLRAGLAACPAGKYTVSGGTPITVSISELRVAGLGDSSFAVVQRDEMLGSPGLDYEEFVQVGSDVVKVTVYPMKLGTGDPATLEAQLATVAKAQVTKLGAAQPKR